MRGDPSEVSVVMSDVTHYLNHLPLVKLMIHEVLIDPPDRDCMKASV